MLIPILIAIVLSIFLFLNKKYLFYIGLLLLFFINIYRGINVGTDYKNYTRNFDYLKNINFNIQSYYSNALLTDENHANKEIAWYNLNNFIKQVGGSYLIVNTIAIL